MGARGGVAAYAHVAVLQLTANMSAAPRPNPRHRASLHSVDRAECVDRAEFREFLLENVEQLGEDKILGTGSYGSVQEVHNDISIHGLTL